MTRKDGNQSKSIEGVATSICASQPRNVDELVQGINRKARDEGCSFVISGRKPGYHVVCLKNGVHATITSSDS